MTLRRKGSQHAGLAQLGERQTEVKLREFKSEGHVFDPHKPHVILLVLVALESENTSCLSSLFTVFFLASMKSLFFLVFLVDYLS
jgi:hypothetical protein